MYYRAALQAYVYANLGEEAMKWLDLVLKTLEQTDDDLDDDFEFVLPDIMKWENHCRVPVHTFDTFKTDFDAVVGIHNMVLQDRCLRRINQVLPNCEPWEEKLCFFAYRPSRKWYLKSITPKFISTLSKKFTGRTFERELAKANTGLVAKALRILNEYTFGNEDGREELLPLQSVPHEYISRSNHDGRDYDDSSGADEDSEECGDLDQLSSEDEEKPSGRYMDDDASKPESDQWSEETPNKVYEKEGGSEWESGNEEDYKKYDDVYGEGESEGFVGADDMGCDEGGNDSGKYILLSTTADFAR